MNTHEIRERHELRKRSGRSWPQVEQDIADLLRLINEGARCPSTFTDRDDEHKLYECHLLPGHDGAHYGCHGAVWTDVLTAASVTEGTE